MRIDVRYFAVVRERLDREGETLEIPDGSSVGALLAILAERDRSLQPLLPYLRAAVNQEIVQIGRASCRERVYVLV